MKSLKKLAILTGCTVLLMSANAMAANKVSGFYRYEKNKLPVSHGCVIRMKGPDSSEGKSLYVVLSNKELDCEGVSKADDTYQAMSDFTVNNSQGTVSLYLNDSGEVYLNTVFFQTWSPLDSFSAQGAFDVSVKLTPGNTVQGRLTTSGVKIISMATDKELEVEIDFDLPAPGK